MTIAYHADASVAETTVKQERAMLGRVEPLVYGGLDTLAVHGDYLVAATRSVADLTGARAVVCAVVGADGQRLVQLERGQTVPSARGVRGR